MTDVIEAMARAIFKATAMFKATMPHPPSPDWEDCITLAHAAVAGAGAMGWVLVPMRANPQMVSHGVQAFGEGLCTTAEIKRTYFAMLAASPKP